MAAGKSRRNTKPPSNQQPSEADRRALANGDRALGAPAKVRDARLVSRQQPKYLLALRADAHLAVGDPEAASRRRSGVGCVEEPC
jgi:hypothetical protein